MRCRYVPGVLVIACLFFGLACGGDSDETLVVAAAADLRDALEDQRDAFEEATSTDITFVFGSSGQMREQIAAGADYDVFLSADIGFIEALETEGNVIAETAGPYAVGRLALAWRDGIEPLDAVEDLDRDDLDNITIANPGHAPYGRAAREALESTGTWAAIEDRLVYGENVRQATDYIESGNADAGMVALSLVLHTGVAHVVVPAALHEPLLQGAAVVTRTDMEDAARRYLDFLRGSEGQAILADYGFEAP